jgi:alkanesulfonate monooxygenase SsuD/methylene tetrahydromethanopterin reductase-like flavin-dependent oxidoreductase (luciferase family)
VPEQTLDAVNNNWSTASAKDEVMHAHRLHHFLFPPPPHTKKDAFMHTHKYNIPPPRLFPPPTPPPHPPLIGGC